MALLGLSSVATTDLGEGSLAPFFSISGGAAAGTVVSSSEKRVCRAVVCSLLELLVISLTNASVLADLPCLIRGGGCRELSKTGNSSLGGFEVIVSMLLGGEVSMSVIPLGEVVIRGDEEGSLIRDD